jgi:hypothetical protein
MCRADVELRAQEAAAQLLHGIAQSLADQENIDVATVRIGPVDFGSPEKSEVTA